MSNIIISIEAKRFQQSLELAVTPAPVIFAGGSNLHSGCRCEEAGLRGFSGHIGTMQLKHDRTVI